MHLINFGLTNLAFSIISRIYAILPSQQLVHEAFTSPQKLRPFFNKDFYLKALTNCKAALIRNHIQCNWAFFKSYEF